MKKEYILKYYDASKWGDYIVYGLDNYNSESSELFDYNDLYDLYQVSKSYKVSTILEFEEQMAKRLAKQKAEKRNNKIDQILGE